MNRVAHTHDPTIIQGGHLNRRQFLQSTASVGLSLAGLALLEGCGPQLAAPAAEPPPETTTIRLSRVASICVAPQYFAQEYLKAEGFTEVQYVEKDISALIASGEADFGLNFAAPVIARVDAGDPAVVLAGVHTGCFELFGTERVRTISDLKGKTVAVGDLLTNAPQYVFLSSMAAYVGLDPNKDINWVKYQPAEAMQLLAEGKIDAYLGFPPIPQQLRNKKIGHVVVNSMMDKPWSQYFCCVATVNREFMRKNPVATKRALRALLKAADTCTREPEQVARFLVDKGFTPNYDYALQTLQEMKEAYGTWREYDPEDTLRFYALRLREAGMIKSSPNEIIARGTDWRFLNELKKEATDKKSFDEPNRLLAYACQVDGGNEAALPQ
jgi:NitT/TauT family transport system substrate-binding protein